MDAIFFYLFGALALVSALIVVGQRNPVYSAFALIVTLCSLSAIYGLLGSPFIAVLQVIVYAGAIMVLFLFVIMLLDVGREQARREVGIGVKTLALGFVVVFLAQAGVVLLGADLGPPAASVDGSVRGMARSLFSLRFLYVFEATSILIVAALVGAVGLARKERP